jgi:flagellar protein FlgJ
MALNTVSTPANLPAWDPRLTGSLKSNGNKAEDDAKLKKACQEMESVFLNMLLKTMRATVPKSELGGNTQQTETMQSMMDMEMTRNMAAAGGTGIAAMMYRNLKNPGVAQPQPNTVVAANKVAK